MSHTHKNLILITETGRTRAKEEACHDTKLLVTGICLKMKAFPLGATVEATRPTIHQYKAVCTNTTDADGGCCLDRRRKLSGQEAIANQADAAQMAEN